MAEHILRSVIVTGSNKGVGKGIIENLAAKPFHIIMAVRSIARGEETRNEILKAHPTAKIDVLELDVDSSASITAFAAQISKNYGSVDVLLNNSGMAFKGDAFDGNVVEQTFKTNFFGTIELTEKILPYIKHSGKVIFVGSSVGKLRLVQGNADLLARYTSATLTKEDLFKLAGEFHAAVKDNTYAEKGWAKSAYGLSKLNINSYARVLGAQKEIHDRNIQVYTCCPGWVRTDMAGDKAPRSIEEGAVNPVYLVQLPHTIDPALQGKFFYDQTVTSL